MRSAATRPHATHAAHVPSILYLYLAFELGNTEWKLAITTRVDQAPLVRMIPARSLTTLETEIGRAKVHFSLAGRRPGAKLLRGRLGWIRKVRRKLLQKCEVHTLVRLPTGIFYAQGVKARKG